MPLRKRRRTNSGGSARDPECPPTRRLARLQRQLAAVARIEDHYLWPPTSSSPSRPSARRRIFRGMCVLLDAGEQVHVHPDALAHALLPVEVDAQTAPDPVRVAFPDGAVLLTAPNHAPAAASEYTPTLVTDATLAPSRHSPPTTKATDPCAAAAAAAALVHSSQLTLAGLLIRSHGGTLCDAFGPWTTHIVLADEHDNDNDDDDNNNNNHGDDGGGEIDMVSLLAESRDAKRLILSLNKDITALKRHGNPYFADIQALAERTWRANLAYEAQ
ncbi:hypothetical protein HK405_002603, partial [Cladochytrium tenue]